jgi:hypothetical protein
MEHEIFTFVLNDKDHLLNIIKLIWIQNIICFIISMFAVISISMHFVYCYAMILQYTCNHTNVDIFKYTRRNITKAHMLSCNDVIAVHESTIYCILYTIDKQSLQIFFK